MLTTYVLALLPVAGVGLLALTGDTDPDPGRTIRDDPPREFGDVDWNRRIEPALKSSAADGKPVMLLFQEVPG